MCWQTCNVSIWEVEAAKNQCLQCKFKVSLTPRRPWLKNAAKHNKSQNQRAWEDHRQATVVQGRQYRDLRWTLTLRCEKDTATTPPPRRSPLLCSVDPWDSVPSLPLCQNHPEHFLRTSDLACVSPDLWIGISVPGRDRWLVTDFPFAPTSLLLFVSIRQTVLEQRIRCLKQNRTADFLIIIVWVNFLIHREFFQSLIHSLNRYLECACFGILGA